jgi:hypothetical protein
VSRKWISCPTHGKKQRGYAICNHVFKEGAEVTTVIEPNPAGFGMHRTLGSICCSRPASEHDAKDLSIVCGACAKHHGYTKLSRSDDVESP